MEDKVILTKEEATKIAKIKDNQIHNFITAPFGLVGANYDLETFNQYLNEALCIEVGGDNYRGMNHALAVFNGKKVYFFEHDEENLKELLKEKGIE